MIENPVFNQPGKTHECPNCGAPLTEAQLIPAPTFQCTLCHKTYFAVVERIEKPSESADQDAPGANFL